MRSTLLATYEFPPAGGGGVQRVAKFARYLPEHGWEPVIVTSAPTRGRPLDITLLDEVAGLRVLRLPPRRVSTYTAALLAPVKRARALLRRPGEAPAGSSVSAAASRSASPAPTSARSSPTAPSASARLARCVSLDDASWWARAAVGAGVRLGSRQGVQAVIASGPPFSVTRAGAAMARRLGAPLVVDMRDGWRDNPTAWYPSAAHRARALAAERAVLESAAVVLATTSVIAEEARQLGARDVRVLPNGYDAADVAPWEPHGEGPLRLAFMGKMYRNHSEPWDLLAALSGLRRSRPDLDITLDVIGDEWSAVRERAATDGLADRVSFAGYLPHREAVRRLARADVAVAIVADRPGARATALGKLYEYMGVGIPVLALVPPDGESARLVREGAAGWVVASHDRSAIAARLTELAEGKRLGAPMAGADPAFAARYDRRALTGELAAVLDEVVPR